MRSLRWAVWVGCAPLGALLHVAGWRRLDVIVERIGHMAAEVDALLKDRALTGAHANHRIFIAARVSAIANPYLMKIIASKVHTVTTPVVAGVLRWTCAHGLAQIRTGHYLLAIEEAAQYGRISAEWDGRKPLFALPDEDLRSSEVELESIGVPKGAWFVCVHARDGGYSPWDERAQGYRNSRIADLELAVRGIRDQGGYCIRMGDPTMPRLRGALSELCIDYAHAKTRTPRMDILLCALCRFFLGNTSGLFLVSSVFGRPCAVANAAPFSSIPFTSQDLYIPKLYVDKVSGRVLTFREALAHPASKYRNGVMFEEAGLTLRDNAPEEIRGMVDDMLRRLDGLEFSLTERGLQEGVAAMFRPSHHGYGSRARLAPSFATQHRELVVGENANG